jgi:hypothetical protein
LPTLSIFVKILGNRHISDDLFALSSDNRCKRITGIGHNLIFFIGLLPVEPFKDVLFVVVPISHSPCIPTYIGLESLLLPIPLEPDPHPIILFPDPILKLLLALQKLPQRSPLTDIFVDPRPERALLKLLLLLFCLFLAQACLAVLLLLLQLVEALGNGGRLFGVPV